MLYKSLVLPILIFGLEVLFPTDSEITMLEQCQLSILRIILGLPNRVPSVSLHYLLGMLPIKLLLFRSHLSFCTDRLLSLSDTATSKCLFLSRYQTARYGFSHRINSILGDLDLPDVVDLMSIAPSKLAWSAFVKTSLHCLFRDTFDSSATSMPSLSDVVALEPLNYLKFILFLRAQKVILVLLD